MHRIAAATVWMALVLASVVAFQVYAATDEVKPVGMDRSFDVVEVETVTKGAAIDAIAETATELHRNIFKVQPDPQDSMQRRILFVFVGDDVAFRSRGGFDYPAFSTTAISTRMLPAESITTEDLRGSYVTDADAGQMQDLLAMLDEAGLAAEETTLTGTRGGLAILGYSVGQANIAGSFTVMAVALWLAVAYSVARNRKVYALKALHGYRRAGNLGSELAGATATLGAGVVVLLVVGTPLLGFYNQFRQVFGFFRVLAIAIGVLYLLLLALVALAVLTLPSVSIPAVLKGEQVSVRNAVLAAVAQVAVLAIVVATTSAAMNRIEAVQSGGDVAARWSQGDPLYALRLSTAAVDMADQKAAAPGLAETVATMELAGEALLAHYEGRNLPGETTSVPSGSEEFTPLIVNNAYLQREVVRDPAGQRVASLPEEEDRFTLLVPTSFGGNPEELLQTYAEHFRFICSVGTSDDACNPQGRIVPVASGQDLFIYNGTAFEPAESQRDTLFLHSPVVAVVAASSNLVSPLYKVSIASQDNLLFSNPDALDAGLAEHGSWQAFQGIDNAADAVAASVAISERNLRMDAFGLVLSWAVLVLSSIVMVSVYCDRRKRPMFVELIHGYGFAARHWRYVLGVLLLSLSGVAIAGLVGGSLSRGREVVAAAAFIAVQIVIALVAIRAYESRFRADFIKRY